MCEVVRLGHPALREKSASIDPSLIGTQDFKVLINDMVKAMRQHNGVGIAAPQIGVPIRVFCVECRTDKRYKGVPNIPLYTVINPTVTVVDSTKTGIYEGCLSIPGLRGWVERPRAVRLQGLGSNGKKIDRIVKGFHARILQHEYDHLNGKVFLDRVKDTQTLCYEDFLK